MGAKDEGYAHDTLPEMTDAAWATASAVNTAIDDKLVDPHSLTRKELVNVRADIEGAIFHLQDALSKIPEVPDETPQGNATRRMGRTLPAANKLGQQNKNRSRTNAYLVAQNLPQHGGGPGTTDG